MIIGNVVSEGCMMKHESVYKNILKPLENYYGTKEFETKDNARFFYQSWIDILKKFKEETHKKSFQKILLENEYMGWPTVKKVYDICEKIEFPSGRMPSPAGG